MSEGAGSVGDSPRESKSAQDRRSRPVEWILLEGNRWLVTAGILAGAAALFGLLLAAGVVGVEDSDALTRGFAAMVGGNMTLITIVISINQLVLSREFGTPAELEEQIDEMMAYRKEAEETADVPVSPVTPNAFLELLVRSIRDEAFSLSEAVGERSVEADLRGEIEAFADALTDQTNRTIELPEEPPTEAFSALLTVLDADFTGSLHRARWLRTVRGEDLPEEANESLDNLCQLFRLIGVLRQYLETLHLQRELALLSRRLFYVGVPAIAVSLGAIWVYGHPSGTTIEGSALRAVIVGSTVVGFAPLAVFFGYMIRIATVTRRTAGLIPFTVQK